MKKVLVTGGAGFLGSHLCERLLCDGHKVLCADNFSTGRRSNIAPLLQNSNFEVIEHDIVNPLYVEVDEIYNLACPASPTHYQIDPVRTIKTSILGAINMLGLARRLDARILQASTSEIYGDPKAHPQKESYWGHVNPIGVRSCYDEGKRCAETLFFDYHRVHNVDIKVVRIFNTYGPKMQIDDGRVISRFVVQALRGESITINGDGTQTRSFCYVDDLIEAILKTMTTARAFTGPVNVGHSSEISIMDLARMVVRLVGSSSRVSFTKLPDDDPRQRQPDTGIAQNVLQWNPVVGLEEGLLRTISYFRSLLRE